MTIGRVVAALSAVLIPGSLALAQARVPAHPDSTTRPRLVTVTGTVFDSVARQPLGDALVQLETRTDSGDRRFYSVRTDPRGHYRIDRVARGQYLATFFHPALDDIGLSSLLWQVDVSDSITHASFAIPSPATIWQRSCAAGSAADSTGLLVGHVRDADSGRSLARSTVTISWKQFVLDQARVRVEPRELTATADAHGYYALCGVPSGWKVLVRAEYDGASSGSIELQVPRHTLLHRDFAIGGVQATMIAAANVAARNTRAEAAADSVVQHGSARLAGTVRNADGEPMRDVNVLLAESGAQQTTDESGRFRLTGLPAGTYALHVRRVGFAPTQVVVDLRSDSTMTVAITLDERAAVLDEVMVYGTRRRGRSSSGFFERRQLGFGHFITKQEIEQWHPRVLSEVFHHIAGIQVVPTARGFGHMLRLTRGGPLGSCTPTVYLDGIPMKDSVQGDPDIDWFAAPPDIAGIGVYSGPATTPPQFPGRHGCGSVLIWTGFHARE